MTRIIMNGCNGRMGRMISDITAGEENAEIVAGIDIAEEGNHPYPVYTDIAACDTEADVVIDFTTAKALERLLGYCTEKKLPLVLCTTGFSAEQLDKVKKASEVIPILRSANMSLGINTMMKLLQVAAHVFAEAGYDMEIVEKHHRNKLDAPSGTAIALADAINEVLPEPYEYVYDRSERREKRPDKEIGISAVRGGTIVGEHEVFFCGQDEVIEIKHTAYSRAVFAKGAVEAAKYLAGKAPGLYSMKDVIG